MRQRPKIIGHRGFSGIAPENTLAAIRAAIATGVDMIEVDLTLSRDGAVVCFHDETLDRVTNGHGLLRGYDLADLRLLDAGRWFAPEFAGEPLPTLEEVLDSCRGRVALNLEIKPEAFDPARPLVLERTLAALTERSMVDNVVISSFDPRVLLESRRLAPDLERASLLYPPYHRNSPPRAIVDQVGATALHVERTQATPDLIAACRESALPLRVYTVNTDDDMRRLIDAGVDGLFTDFPDRLRDLLV